MMLDVTMARMVMGMTENNDDDAVKVPATNQMVMRRIELTTMSITLVNAIINWMRIMIIMMSMMMIIVGDNNI